MASHPITSWQIGEKIGNSGRLHFLRLQNHCGWWLQPWNWKTLAPCKKSYDKHRQHIKKQRHHFADKAPSSQSYDFSNSHVWMWELGHKENWAQNNWSFWTVVLKRLESLLDSKIKPISPKWYQPWVFIGRTDAETEAPVLWLADVMSPLIEKDLDAGKDWRQEKKMKWLVGITSSMDVSFSNCSMTSTNSIYTRYKLQEIVKDRESWCIAVLGITELDMAEQLNRNNKTIF